ncbi:ABC transporter permease [Halorubellus sp. JP-L1]|uniref:ABC transporter permease n=1 Tax=Halorubellus sp. JP-L1 TaxID=2715753 RepID=UPI00140B02E5|nr:ABC transporter permease [Halorubellus sp. JP-L1]NHN43234.1 ABC transporter permease [Halorubellus sp. JP-L1]
MTANRPEATAAPTEHTERTGIDVRVVAVVAGTLLLALYTLPVLALVVSMPPGALLDRMGDPQVVAALGNSLLTASAATVVATLFGVPLAYWLSRTDGRVAAALTGVVVLPLVLPPVVAGILLVAVFGPSGLAPVESAFGVAFTRSHLGIVAAQTFVASPFVVVTSTAAFDRVDPDLEDAARSLGHDRTSTFRRVTLPLAWPGVLAGVTLTFARSMGEFGATMLVAYHPRTVPVQIWRAFVGDGVAAALPVAAVLLGVSLAVVAGLHALGTNPWR